MDSLLRDPLIDEEFMASGLCWNTLDKESASRGCSYEESGRLKG